MYDLQPAQSRSAFLCLHPRDNVLICIRAMTSGTAVTIDGHDVILTADIPLGHKIARSTLAVGDKVIRYGAAIGSMTTAAAPGDHVHDHNLKSDYIPAHRRGLAQVENGR